MSRDHHYQRRNEGQRVSVDVEDIPLSNFNPGYGDDTLTYAYDGPNDYSGRRGSDASSYESSLHAAGSSRRDWASRVDGRQSITLMQELPSRQLENAVMNAPESRHTLKRKGKSGKSLKKAKSIHATMRLAKGSNVAEDLIRAFEEDDSDDIDVEHKTNEILRGVPTTLSSKKTIRRHMSERRKNARPGWFKRLKYNYLIRFRHFRYRVVEITSYLELWRSHLIKIEGHFGTGVISYFNFLKWLFLLNIPVFMLTLAFVIIPQVLFRYYNQAPAGYQNRQPFTGKELLTGAGWFDDTEMYYGFYTNRTINVVGSMVYQMKYAYLFTCGGYYLLSLIILILSMSKSYRKNYIETSSDFKLYYVTKVFTGWMYGITSPEAAALKQKSNHNELKEYLSHTKHKKVARSLETKCIMFVLRAATNLLVLALIVGSGYLIWYVSTTASLQTSIEILSELAMPLCISGINLILPFVFTAIAMGEKYSKPKYELYITMLRTMVLKAVTLGVLIFFWFNKVSEDLKCWENFIGQEIYRLVLVDFVFTLLGTFFVEFIRRLCVQYCCPSLRYPEFNIGRNTLDLIYSQVLCWLGTFYSPVLSLIVMVKFFIIFYVKRISVIENCHPSMKVWRAAKTHTIFMLFLFAFFLLATVTVTCSIIFLVPSRGCGPYSDYNTTYTVVQDLLSEWEVEQKWLTAAIGIISSPGFIASVLIFLGVGTYYIRIVMIGQKTMVKLLHDQLAMEGRDKAYLLGLMQNAAKLHKAPVDQTDNGRLRHRVPDDAAASSMISPELDFGADMDPTSPLLQEGGKMFIKSVATAQATSYGTESSYSSGVEPRRRRDMKADPRGAASVENRRS